MVKNVEASLKTRRKNREKNKQKFLKVMDETACNISSACAAIGICRLTYYKWLKEDEDFKNSIEELHESRIDFAENKLMECIDAGELGAITFFLETRGKSRGYVKRTEKEHEFKTPPAIGLKIIPSGGKKKETQEQKENK